jgi:hypothetical protein
MAKQSLMRRKNREGRSRAEQGSRSEEKDQDRGRDQLAATSKLDKSVSQIGSSSFYSLQPKETIEDYRAWDSSSTSLVSSRTHA